MLARSPIRALSTNSHTFSSAARQMNVAALGPGRGIGQPLSLPLKTDPLVTSLSLYDIRDAPSVAANVIHVDAHSEELNGYPAYQLDEALDGVQVVVIPAGVPRKMNRDDLLDTNASIVRDLAAAIGRVSPTAYILVISNPVNTTVPIIASTVQKPGVYNSTGLFSVTTLYVVCAARLTAGISGLNPQTLP
ncbi:hypothetical protein CY34DRAFT_786993 [Suillus luteus UH-Slu-Lm8-n1]|uniref:malate dehydrogenase n=1 Tax=Suillus luteus UH-Slu-Lm8-n1 TaxID=930992 RepID=A0A0C9Z9X9_9AGAM|nr:hypothetical protein CY34DRAFT_786993 [Suillus luteus UH-Slu-Lm8-n1]